MRQGFSFPSHEKWIKNSLPQGKSNASLSKKNSVLFLVSAVVRELRIESQETRDFSIERPEEINIPGMNCYRSEKVPLYSAYLIWLPS